MAVASHNGQWIAKGVKLNKWPAMLNGDSGTPISDIYLPNKNCAVVGTFGVGGSISFEGSDDGGTTYNILKDWQGNPITFTAAGNKTIVDNPSLVRPRVTAGDGTTSLTAQLQSAVEGA